MNEPTLRPRSLNHYVSRPCDRYYFAIQSNPGEQFYTFSCLSSWLIKRRSGLELGSQELNPREFGDPNVTISTILHVIREGTSEHIDFPASRLKQGWGSEVLWLLTLLADISLKHNHKHSSSITVKGLQSMDTETEAATSEENEAEISFDEHFNLMEENEDEEETSLQEHQALVSRRTTDPDNLPDDGMPLISDIETSAWMEEVDRVLPQLRVVMRSGEVKSDWRLRVRQLESSRKEMEGEFEGTRVSLDRLTQEIGKNVDKISQREKYLQTQFEPVINEYVSLKSQLSLLMDKYGEASKGVTEKSQILSEISEELESMKSEMEERGASMTDGTPLLSLKKALNRIRSEVSSIDIRIGVATHTILQANLKDSTKLVTSREGGEGQEV